MTSKQLNWEATKYNVRKSGKNRRSRILSVMASVVVFCVTYALIIPALTWEKTLICELPEHTHGESCYTYVTVPASEELICELPEHTHGEDCYTTQLICTLEESEGHTHGAECYDENENLICGQEETAGHTHSEECYNTVLTCTQDEHSHGESCYKVTEERTEKTLTCTLQEHEHTEACYDAPPAAEPGVSCGKSAHTHNDKCYTDGVLTCTMNEHEHSKQCYSDPKADLESAKTWEASIAEVELTGEWSKDVVAIAKSQLGIGESDKNYIVDDSGCVNGYTRYGAWYGNPYGDWCAMFCSFCLHYAGVDTMTFPQNASCPRWVETLSSPDYDLYRPAGEYLPKAGDLIFFDYDSYTDISGRQPNHVGIVTELVEDENGNPIKVKTIEGNTGAGVAANTYDINNDSIMGYAELPLSPVERDLTKAMVRAVSMTVDAWQEVTEIDDTSANYLIVSNSDYAIGVNNSNALTSTEVELMEISGQPGYYTADIGENFQWNFDDTDNSAKMTNAGRTGYGLRLNNSTIISTAENETTNTMTYSESGEYWRISYRGTRNTYYLTCSTSGTFSRSTSSTNSNMKIYKAVQLTTDPGSDPDGPGGNVVKPTYPAYLPVSDAKTGSTVVGTIPGTYWSDPATSQLESVFEGVAEDDGKVLADKSVIYGDDDYDAFNSYAPNTFGVELSALGQKYAITQELQVRVPLDVVFVLDTSGSMINTTYDGVTSANIMVESLNKIMKNVMDANEDNRVGVVCYSGAADKLLDLGRYTATNDKYFPEGQCTSNTYELAPSSSIRRTDGTLYKGTFDRGWYGTFTQDGIALGAQEFFDVQDTTVTKTITQETDEGTVHATYTVTRRPIIILLSDGEPTYCTPDYDNVLSSSNVYGNGNTGYNNNGVQINDSTSSASNNKGILGYYTILTAQNYKDRIAQKYNTDAFFYTIGIGMDPTGNDSYEQSVAGDDYKRAVLNPTADNINHLNECTTATCKSDTVSAANSNISGKIDQTCRMLYRLLHNTQTGTTVKIGSHSTSQASQYGMRTTQTQTNVPIKTNAYLTSGYSYADGAFFSANNSVETLTNAFTNAISYTDIFPVYGFILKSNTPMTVSDTIGDGMELKSEPVLRYGGVNHNPTSHETVGNVTTYHYSGTWTATDGSGQSADLSQITATVTTDENGQQTVELIVPDSQLPTYTPNLRNDGSAYFYYEELPVRLIYQVGLTDKAVREVENLEITGGSKTFYTNAWSEEAYSDSLFTPTKSNPYYQNNDYDRTDVPKSDNNTDTKENAWDFSDDSDNTKVNEILGNNGRLTFEDTDVQVVPVSIWKLDSNGSPITTDTAIFEVYADTDLTILVGSYETDSTGKLVIPAIRTGRTFYLKEAKAPYGYKMIDQLLPFSVREDGTVTGLSSAIGYYRVNAAGELEILNDDGSRYVEVEKHWAGDLLPGEEYPTSVEIQLFADGSPVRSAATLNAGNGWYYKWEDLPILSAVDKHEIEYTVKESVIPSGYLPSYEQDEDGVWIVTNRKVEITSLSVIKKWIGGTAESAQIELLRNGEPTGRFAVLNEENDWYYLWNNLPVCDENGDLTYSVREIAMNGYETDVHLWNGPDDPYGFTETEETLTVNSFSDGLNHLLVFNGKALAVNEAGTGLTTVDYEDGDEITDEMLWTASVSGSNITLISVSANKRLVLNSSNEMALGATSTHATTWRFDSSRLYANYTRYNIWTTSYYFNGTVSNGVGTTSTSSDNGTALSLRTHGITRVYDVENPGEMHYIVVNTKVHYEPPDLTLTIRKISSEDIGNEQPVLLNGAKFDLYLETGVVEDGQIPGTDGRIGKVIQSITCDGTAEITLSEDGTYFLVETEAPEGYMPLTEPIIFTVSSEKEVRTATIDYHPVLESGTLTEGFDVPNTPTVYELPETGGMGTVPYYTTGFLLIVAALVCGCFLRRKRREEV